MRRREPRHMATSVQSRRKARRRPSRSSLVRRWLALGALVVVGLLYVKPLRTYLETRQTLAQRTAEVRALAAQKRALERELAAQSTTPALVRNARRLGYVKPGERLYIVKGIDAWRAAEDGRRRRPSKTP